jgi:hypothetical protein
VGWVSWRVGGLAGWPTTPWVGEARWRGPRQVDRAVYLFPAPTPAGGGGRWLIRRQSGGGELLSRRGLAANFSPLSPPPQYSVFSVAPMSHQQPSATSTAICPFMALSSLYDALFPLRPCILSLTLCFLNSPLSSTALCLLYSPLSPLSPSVPSKAHCRAKEWTN